MQQIIQNAVILVQDLQFIENRERFSLNDHQFEKERHKKLQQHWLNFTGFGVDDFASEEGRTMSVFCWLEKRSRWMMQT